MRSAVFLLLAAGCGADLQAREICYSDAKIEFWNVVEQCAGDKSKSVEQCNAEADRAMDDFRKRQEACP